MIGRDQLLRCDSAASPTKMRGKAALPELHDANYFKQMAESERVKVSSSRRAVDSKDIALLPDNEAEIVLPETMQLSGFATPFLIDLNANIAGHSTLLKDAEVDRVSARDSGLVNLVQDKFSLKQSKETDKKTAQITPQNLLHSRVIEDTKSKIDLSQTTATKPDTEIVLALSSTTFMPANFMLNPLLNPIANTRISDLPHVMRVQIDHVKRTSAGVLTSLELVLEPAELGRITARIQHEEGRLVLTLNAEHKHIAEDLSRDSGLLMRALGDHIPGLDRMSVFVQSEGSQSSQAQRQRFADARAGGKEHNSQQYNGADKATENPQGAGSIATSYTTSSSILI